MKPDPTRNARATRYRAGGTLVSVRIGPEAAAILARMRQTMTVREAVETAIMDADKSGPSCAPVGWQWQHPGGLTMDGKQWLFEQHWNRHTATVSRPVYAAPPPPSGMFSAEEMKAAYMNGRSERAYPDPVEVTWSGSATLRLIQERTAKPPPK